MLVRDGEKFKIIQRKVTLAAARYRWEKVIKTDVKDMWYQLLDCIHLPWDWVMR
jgi:hypothetical protein